MADNLSALLTDAFDIYSEAYVKIAELGSRIVDLDKKPLQPKKYKQLVEATNLYIVVSDSINLNDAGTAIEGVVGDIEIVNNLLLKLKRSVGLNSLPQFPTPLTQFTFTGDCECDGTSSCPAVDQVDTTASTLEFDLEEECKKAFLGSADITSTKTWSFLNTGGDNAYKEFKFSFVIDGLTPGDATHDQTMPSSVKMSDGRVVSTGPNVWRPYADGEYMAKATTFNNGLTWKLEISDVWT